MEKAAAQHIPSHPSNLPMSANKQKARLESKYGLLTRTPRTPYKGGGWWMDIPCPTKWFAVYGIFEPQKGWRRSRNVERFRWQMSKAKLALNASGIKFFSLNQIRPIYRSLSPTMTILSIMHFFALPDTDPGCKKQGTRLVRDVMRRGPVSFTFAEKELFARHHSHQMVGKTCCDMGVCVGWKCS